MSNSGDSNTWGVLGTAGLTTLASLVGMGYQSLRQRSEREEEELKRAKHLYVKVIDYVDADESLRARPARRHGLPRERRRQREQQDKLWAKHRKKGKKLQNRLRVEGNTDVFDLFGKFLEDPPEVAGEAVKKGIDKELVKGDELRKKVRRRRRIEAGLVLIAVFAIAFLAYTAWAWTHREWIFEPAKPTTSVVHRITHTHASFSQIITAPERHKPPRRANPSRNHHEVSSARIDPAPNAYASPPGIVLPIVDGILNNAQRTLNGLPPVVHNVTGGVQSTLNGLPPVIKGLTDGL